MPVVILGLGWGRLAAEKKPLENRKTNPAATPGGDYSPDLSIPMVLVRQIGSQVENKSLDHSSGAFAGSVGSAVEDHPSGIGRRHLRVQTISSIPMAGRLVP
jgi:hypothetical protein